MPRSAQAEIDFPKRRDPVALLEEQAASRVPELVPIRYGRMLASPFAFYRGGALIMAADLARTPNSGLRVQLCGDAHLSNFGVFGSPERNLVFDMNDFDETAPGPWEWDVKRLAASFAIGGRENGFSGKERRAVVLDTVRAYREAMTAFAQMRNLDVWYAHLSVERAVAEFTAGVDPKRLKKAEANIEKSRTKDSMQAFEKLTHLVDGEPRIISDPPLIVPIDELLPSRSIATRSWTRSATSSAPTGGRSRPTVATCSSSSGSSTWPARSSGSAASAPAPGSRSSSASTTQDPLFLQIKEAQPSVLEQFVGKSEYNNSGRRVVAGQRLMQATSDIFLGWQHVSSGLDGKERDFYVRQLKDWKGSFAFEAAVPAGAAAYGKSVRLDTRPRARPLRRPGRNRLLPRQVRRLRPGSRRRSPRRTPTRTNATTTLSSERSSRAGSLREPGSRRSSPRGREFHRGATSERRGIQPKRMMILARLGA